MIFNHLRKYLRRIIWACGPSTDRYGACLLDILHYLLLRLLGFFSCSCESREVPASSRIPTDLITKLQDLDRNRAVHGDFVGCQRKLCVLLLSLTCSQ